MKGRDHAPFRLVKLLAYMFCLLPRSRRGGGLRRSVWALANGRNCGGNRGGDALFLSSFPAAPARACGRCRARCIQNSSSASSTAPIRACSARRCGACRPATASRAHPAVQQRSPLPRPRGAGARRHHARGDLSSSRSPATRRPRSPSRRLPSRRDDPDAILAVMPSDHVVEDDAGLRRRRPARRRSRGHGPARPVRHQADRSPTPATATSASGAAAGGWRTAAPSRSTPSSRSPTPPPPGLSRCRQLSSGTAASSCCTPAPSSTSCNVSRPRSSTAARRRARQCAARTSASCASTATPSPRPRTSRSTMR